jgi:hypothetical protein
LEQVPKKLHEIEPLKWRAFYGSIVEVEPIHVDVGPHKQRLPEASRGLLRGPAPHRRNGGGDYCIHYNVTPEDLSSSANVHGGAG